MKKRIIKTALLFTILLFHTGCSGRLNTDTDAAQNEAGQKYLEEEAVSAPSGEATAPPSLESAPELSMESSPEPSQRPVEYTASSYNLGSAKLLQGRQILVSVFLTEKNTQFSVEEKQSTLDTIAAAASYIEESVAEYGTSVTFLYADKTEIAENNLLLEETVDYSVSGSEDDYYDALDSSIAEWFERDIDYDSLLKEYDAEGIVTLIFVNNKGTSYAIVYDGEDDVKESTILFKDSATVYAHELLHIYGAHDLYQGAEYSKELTDFISEKYPEDIMFDVNAPSQKEIIKKITPITAYELGLIDELEELEQFPELTR